MALSFLKDRDENDALGNLGAFAPSTGATKSVQNALEIYRKDQKSHHEQSIASDLTRGLLRKIFRETVLESSKQVKRKYSYSAVGSTIAEEMEAESMGIMSKLKKLQKERLIVARLGFPDKAMEIDEHIETIRADLRKEREKEDSRIMEEALAALAVEHKERLEKLEKDLKQDAKNKKASFEQERSVLLRKQERQFAQLVDGAIKRAIGKSKAWEEKAAELDAEHLDKWREEVAASLTASAWGGSSSALDQLATQHQREIKRMETAQANDWTLMLMRHHTLRRNCQNVIMVEQKKLRNTCKKNAEERHRREMLGVQEAMDGATAPGKNKRSASAGPQGRSDGSGRAASEGDDDVAGMLQDVMNANATDGDVTPARPSSAPPARGRRPQPNRQHATSAVAGEKLQNDAVAEAWQSIFGGSGGAGNSGGDEDDNSSAGDSHDLRGFDELERQDFNYDEYPAAGSPEEVEWLHIPWCGTNSGDISVLDEPPQPRTALTVAKPTSPPLFSPANVESAVASDIPSDGGSLNLHGKIEGKQSLITTASEGGPDVEQLPESTSAISDPRRSGREELEKSIGSGNDKSTEDGGGAGGDTRAGRSISASRRPITEDGLTRHDWDATKIPTRPALSAASRIPSGTRAEKIKARNARKSNPNRKAVSWGQNVEVPPEAHDDGEDGGAQLDEEGGGVHNTGDFGLPPGMIDDIVNNYVEEEGTSEPSVPPPSGRNESLTFLSRNEGSTQQREVESGSTAAEGAAGIPCASPIATTVGVEEDRGEEACPKSPPGENDGANAQVHDSQTFPAEKRQSVSVKEGAGQLPAASQTFDTEQSQPDVIVHPLQCALDVFCSIRLLHGDWMSLLQQMVGQEACRICLRRWRMDRRWPADVDMCSQATPTRSEDGRLSWGTASAAAAAIASPEILTPFVASLPGQAEMWSTKGRLALGGSTVADEPALSRSRRPWRTLFERSLGSLPHGAVLGLTEAPDKSSDERIPFGKAGKVVWANEGFERLAGVDAADVVGQRLPSLFDAGDGDETELAQSLELGQSCKLWMAMVGKNPEPAEVLCLHQPVLVPRELSDEGHYNVLLFFEVTSAVLVGRGGCPGSSIQGVEGSTGEHRRSSAVPGGADGHEARRRCCNALSSAMVHLLTGSQNDGGNGDVDIYEADEQPWLQHSNRGKPALDNGELVCRKNDKRQEPTSLPSHDSECIEEHQQSPFERQNAEYDVRPHWRDSDEENKEQPAEIPQEAATEAHHSTRNLSDGTFTVMEVASTGGQDHPTNHRVRPTIEASGTGENGDRFSEEFRDDDVAAHWHETDRAQGGRSSYKIKSVHDSQSPREAASPALPFGATAYSPGGADGKTNDHMLSSFQETSHTRQAVSREEVQDVHLCGGIGMGDANDAETFDVVKNVQDSPVDAGAAVAAGQGEVVAIENDPEDEGSGEDQYEDDFFSDESQEVERADNGNNDGKNSQTTAKDVVLQGTDAGGLIATEGGGRSQQDWGFMNQIGTHSTPSVGLQDNGDETTPFWREEAGATGPAEVQRGRRANEALSSAGDNDSVAIVSSNVHEDNLASGDEEEGYCWSDGVCSSTGGGPNGVFDGVVEDDESWAASGGGWGIFANSSPESADNVLQPRSSPLSSTSASPVQVSAIATEEPSHRVSRCEQPSMGQSGGPRPTSALLRGKGRREQRGDIDWSDSIRVAEPGSPGDEDVLGTARRRYSGS